MGSGRLSTVVRGRIIHDADKALVSPTESLLAAHEALALEKLLDLGKTDGTIPSDGSSDYHVAQEFFGDNSPEAYFPPTPRIPDSVGKKSTILSAYIQALRVSLYKDPNPPEGESVKREQALPIVSYWITGAANFEVYVSLSSTDQEVHVLILTPDPSHHVKEPPAQGLDENMWAIASEGRIKELHDLIPASYGADPSFEIKGAFVQKLKSY